MVSNLFFLNPWKIFKEDIMVFHDFFFFFFFFFSGWNHQFDLKLDLYPFITKKVNAHYVHNYEPISVIPRSYKITVGVLLNRVKEVLPYSV